MEMKEIIASGQAVLGIELGSTRIKAVLIGPDHEIGRASCRERV